MTALSSDDSSFDEGLVLSNQLQYVIPNLNLKGFSFFYTHCLFEPRRKGFKNKSL